MSTLINRLRDSCTMLHFTLKQQFGRFYWWIPLLCLFWPVYKAVTFLESGQLTFTSQDAQNELIGLPVYVLAIGLGIGLIAREIEGRTLEAAYSIAAGCQRLWWLKLVSAAILLLVAELALALISWIFFTTYPVGVLWRVWQGAVFFLVLAMGAGALLRSELAAAFVTGSLLLLIYTRFEANRWLPLFNPLKADHVLYTDMFTALLQNHVSTLLLTGLLLALAMIRAEQREKLLH